MKTSFYLIAILTCFCTQPASAQIVDNKNGNFYISYTDIAFSDPTNLKLTRSYQSKSSNKGWFGIGWGGPFETYLHTVPGGGVAVVHWASGSTENFLSKEPDVQLLSADINLIVTAAQKAKKVNTPDEIFQLRQEMEANQEKRVHHWKKYIDEGLIQEKRLEPGRFQSVSTPNNYVLVSPDGYEFFQGDYKLFFDTRGRMVSYKAPKFPALSLQYEESRFPVNLKDSLGNEIALFFNSSGQVEKAIGTNTKGKKDTSVYTYDRVTKALSSSRDIGGNFYRFEFDNSYDMVKILYTDSTTTEIEYDQRSFATRLKKRNGSYTIYEYSYVSDLEYGNRNIQFDSLGNQVKSIAHWYVTRINELGTVWTYKWIIVNDNDSTTYIRNEKFGSADTVYQNGGRFFAYDYDNKGNLKGIHYSTGQKVRVQVNGERLEKISTEKNIYQAVYKGSRIEKLVPATGDAISLPLASPFADTQGHVGELIRIFPAFMATAYWYDLQINDSFLRAARKLLDTELKGATVDPK